MKTHAATTALIVLTGCTSLPQPHVLVPDSLKPGVGEKLALVVAAKGVQIYECRASKAGGKPDWAFVAPEADLYDADGKRIGRHYAGPHWEAADGSKVVGSVKARAEAQSGGDIPWLLLDAKSVGRDGVFSKVTSIQRVATVGGIAPGRECGEPGAKARIGYTADYYFFTAP
jgi:hypothetical protein